MSLKFCKVCGSPISSSSKICLKCGNKSNNNETIIVITLLVFIILCICSLIFLGNQYNFFQPEDIEDNTKINLSKFYQIQVDMTYDEVVSIIGSDGILSTESSYGNQVMQIYYWENGFSNATVSFLNNKVTAKSQIGLTD